MSLTSVEKRLRQLEAAQAITRGGLPPDVTLAEAWPFVVWLMRRPLIWRYPPALRWQGPVAKYRAQHGAALDNQIDAVWPGLTLADVDTVCGLLNRCDADDTRYIPFWPEQLAELSNHLRQGDFVDGVTVCAAWSARGVSADMCWSLNWLRGAGVTTVASLADWLDEARQYWPPA